MEFLEDLSLRAAAYGRFTKFSVNLVLRLERGEVLAHAVDQRGTPAGEQEACGQEQASIAHS
jgi:hypothetical protein